MKSYGVKVMPKKGFWYCTDCGTYVQNNFKKCSFCGAKIPKDQIEKVRQETGT